MITLLAMTGALLLQGQKDVVPDSYFEVNSTYARACSQASLSPAGKREAILECTKALDSEPLNRLGMAQTLTNRGVIRFANGDSAGALDDFNAALDQRSDFALAYTNRAGVFLAQRQFDKAFSDADRSVQLDSSNARAWLMRGGAQEMQGKAAAAYKDYQMAAKLDPSWDRPKAELARFKVGK